MDDIASKITQILGDEDGMKKISQLASSLMSQNESKQETQNSQFSDMQIDPVQMGNIMKMMSLLKSNNKDDNNTRLLVALKPHLSHDRQKKVDKAISIMKIVKLLPLLKESGLNTLFEV